MFYVRRKTDHLKIKAWGHLQANRYEFDPALYEEAEGPLPDGWQKDTPPPSLQERLDSLVTQALSGNLIPAEQRPELYSLEATVDRALRRQDFEAAEAAIENFTWPPELAELKASLLSQF